MRQFIAGATAGLAVAALFPTVADAVAEVLQPLAEASVKAAQHATTAGVELASNVVDTVKDLWAEAQAETQNQRRQAAIIVVLTPDGDAASAS